MSNVLHAVVIVNLHKIVESNTFLGNELHQGDTLTISYIPMQVWRVWASVGSPRRHLGDANNHTALGTVMSCKMYKQ